MDSTSPTADRTVGTDDSPHTRPETTLVETFFAVLWTKQRGVPTAPATRSTRT